MRRDSKIILSTSVLLTAAIIGGAHLYANRSGSSLSIAESESPNATTMPRQHMEALDVSAETPLARTWEIIECHDPEIGTFYTNATACEDADLENRISDAQTLSPSLTRDLNNKKQSTRRKAARKSSAKNKLKLRLLAEAPPPNLPPECRFPVGKALETERSMAGADDPRESIWRDTYCRFRCEANAKRCPVNDSTFYYSFNSVCRGPEPYICYKY